MKMTVVQTKPLPLRVPMRPARPPIRKATLTRMTRTTASSGCYTAANYAAGYTAAIPGSVSPGNGTNSAPAPGAGLNSHGLIIISTSGTGANGTFSSPGEIIFSTSGFRPMEVLKEDDYQYNAGFKFKVLGWDVDAGAGYGKDVDDLYTAEQQQSQPVRRHPHCADQLL